MGEKQKSNVRSKRASSMVGWDYERDINEEISIVRQNLIYRTVSYQAVKTALINPAKSLKTE